METTICFGKIAYNSTRKVNAVEIEIELRKRGGDKTFTIDPFTKEKTFHGKTPEYTELSICGYIWNASHTDIICGGQIYDTLKPYLQRNRLYREVYKLWKRYHLNGCQAGTPEQEAAIREWEAEGNSRNYNAVCTMLKEKGIYEMPYYGLSTAKRWNGETYKYGSAWLIEELPEEVIEKVKGIILKNQ